MNKFVSKMPEGTYIELVRSLFRTLLPTCIMAVSFAATGVLISLQTGDGVLAALTAVGTVAATCRVLILLTRRTKARAKSLSLVDARRLERHFATAYLGFAAIFSPLSWRAFLVVAPEVHLPIVALLFGYAAGIAAGVSLRPWISITAVVIAVTPTMITALVATESAYRAVGCLLAIFMAGGIQSMISRYRHASASITTGLLFATLARSDALTGLPNRLALGEKFHEITATIADRDAIAVHCLDLDRFKPVNDRYGHPVGDLLLIAVADRLKSVLRKGSFAARVGGDEFVIIQTRIADRSEADLMGRRIVRALSEPYTVAGFEISIGASIGYALSSGTSYDLEQIIRSADNALLRAKVRRGTVLCGSASQRLCNIGRN